MSDVTNGTSREAGVFNSADEKIAFPEMTEETVAASAVETPAVRPILVIDIGGSKVKALATGSSRSVIPASSARAEPGPKR